MVPNLFCRNSGVRGGSAADHTLRQVLRRKLVPRPAQAEAAIRQWSTDSLARSDSRASPDKLNHSIQPVKLVLLKRWKWMSVPVGSTLLEQTEIRLILRESGFAPLDQWIELLTQSPSEDQRNLGQLGQSSRQLVKTNVGKNRMRLKFAAFARFRRRAWSILRVNFVSRSWIIYRIARPLMRAYFTAEGQQFHSTAKIPATTPKMRLVQAAENHHSAVFRRNAEVSVTLGLEFPTDVSDRLKASESQMNDSNERPFSIRIFLPDGTPDGVRIIEKSNWTGIGLVIPRSLLPEAKFRDECGRTGVYVLVGQDEQSELPTIYIGLGDPVRPRLERHLGDRDFWTWVVFFATRDNSLNRAHIGYLEAALIKLAHEAKRAKVENHNVPQPSPLSEADAADMDSFLADMLSIFPLVGLTAFERPRAKPGGQVLLTLTGKGITAQGYESPQGFVVVAGSTAVTAEAPSIQPYQAELRKELKLQGVLVGDGQCLRFTQDYAFGSPSTAAAVIFGRAASGPKEWKDSQGRTLRDIQQISATQAPLTPPIEPQQFAS